MIYQYGFGRQARVYEYFRIHYHVHRDHNYMSNSHHSYNYMFVIYYYDTYVAAAYSHYIVRVCLTTQSLERKIRNNVYRHKHRDKKDAHRRSQLIVLMHYDDECVYAGVVMMEMVMMKGVLRDHTLMVGYMRVVVCDPMTKMMTKKKMMTKMMAIYHYIEHTATCYSS